MARVFHSLENPPNPEQRLGSESFIKLSLESCSSTLVLNCPTSQSLAL